MDINTKFSQMKRNRASLTFLKNPRLLKSKCQCQITKLQYIINVYIKFVRLLLTWLQSTVPGYVMEFEDNTRNPNLWFPPSQLLALVPLPILQNF